MRARSRFRYWFAAVAVALLSAALPLVNSSPAHADSNASTGDESVHVPTGWWTYSGVTASQVGGLLTANGARPVDIEVNDLTPTFTVAMVRNSGAYAVPGWWWYYGQTGSQVGALLSANNARPIEIKPYNTAAGVRYVVLMVSNTGAAARGYWWYYNTTSSFISSQLSANNARLVDIETIGTGTAKRYTAVMVPNTGSDAKSWQWWLNLTPSAVGAKIAAFDGRLVHMHRQDDGTYDIILVKQTGTDNIYWRYYFGFSTIARTVQVASQYNTRIFDLNTYVSGGQRRYDALMIDNADPESRRLTDLFMPTFTRSGSPIANMGFYLKQVGGPVVVSLQASQRYEPASAIKAVHNLKIMQQLQNGSASLGDSGYYYDYPDSPSNPNTKDACPVDVDEVPLHLHVVNINFLHDNMMAISDNRATRYFALRYGLGGLQATANAAGMSNTTIGQARIGCGVDGGKNLTTLADLGKLYEGIENGTLLNDTNGARSEFYQPMNWGIGSAIQTVVNQEASKLGKSPTVANSFYNNLYSKVKGGSYNIGCGAIESGCSGAYYYFRDFAGKITIPFKSANGATTSKTYVWGRMIDSLKITNGASTATFDNIQPQIDSEMLRSTINAALQTW
jgi:hypothetical protein